MTSHYPAFHHATDWISAREDKYRQILSKVHNNVKLTKDEEVLVMSLNKLCHHDVNSSPSSSLSWMTACAREIHNVQYSWLVLDSKLLDKITVLYKEGKKLDVRTLC